MTPGEHPSDALRDVDLTAGASLLVVDQCEQAFAADDPAEIREFFDALWHMTFRGTLVVVIRADRLGDLADHEGFAEIIQSHLLMLTALGSDVIRAVIEKPAEQAGLILEPGLVEILVRDSDGRTLPLLSHALRQVWSRREGRVMTVDAYRASGEIEGAVAKTAEEVFAALTVEARGCCATSSSVSSNHPPTAPSSLVESSAPASRSTRPMRGSSIGWSMHACSRPMRSRCSSRTKRSHGSGHD